MSASQNAVTGVLSVEGGDAYLQLNCNVCITS
jgi:hypothetical protein